MKGLLISFDGLDSSGKHTQAHTLAERLRHHGRRVHMFTTPDYATPSGQELKKRLQGKIGNWQQTPWREKLSYFANNRLEHRAEVIAALEAGDVVIYDRYVPSSVAFMAIEAAFEKSDTERETVYQTVKQIEYEQNAMPLETVSIFLDMSPEAADQLLKKRKAAQKDDDEYTDNIAVQQRLYEEYEVMCASDPQQYARIECMDGNKIATIETIAERVWEGIKQRHKEIDARQTHKEK